MFTISNTGGSNFILKFLHETHIQQNFMSTQSVRDEWKILASYCSGMAFVPQNQRFRASLDLRKSNVSDEQYVTTRSAKFKNRTLKFIIES